jgi:thiamine pyrophosphokinase
MPAEEPMNDTVVIVTGAAPLDARAVAAIPSHAIVIAADGGLDHARAAGLTPAGLIGDLDSVSEEGLAWAKQHATIQRHPIDKDATDTELAVAFAAGMNPARVVMVAGGGDRLDHTLAAIGALGATVLTSVPLVECWWGGQYLQVVHGPARVSIRTATPSGPSPGTSSGTPGPETRISLLAMHGPCTGVTLSGTRWELERAELGPLVGHGLSNVAIGPDVELAISTGILTVFIDPPPDSEVRR